MPIMTPGIFPDTVFPDRYWIDDVWADYGIPFTGLIRGDAGVSDQLTSILTSTASVGSTNVGISDPLHSTISITISSGAASAVVSDVLNDDPNII